MIAQKNSSEWEPKLTTAFETAPFSILLMGNVLSIMKSDLIKSGLRDFPVFALTGKPGSGKTTIARACKGYGTKEYSFTGKISAIKKELSSLPDEYIMLDDFAAFASHSSREKANTFLDEVVRLSYSGDMPCMIITVEEQALARITPSCRERLLEIPVDGILKDARLSNTLDYLAEKQYTLDKIFNNFAEWYDHTSSKYDYAALMKETREKYAGKNPRSISIFCTCFLSLCMFILFAKETYHVHISVEKILADYKRLWHIRENRTLSREDLVKKMFQALITDHAFSCVRPKESEHCKDSCTGDCILYGISSYDFCSECPKPPAGLYYDVKDLILNDSRKYVVLIEKPEYFYQYPTYCDLTTPLMIVRADILLSSMNSELHKFCNEQNLRLQPFAPKELHKLLFNLNMCMYNFISNSHKTYTFKYDSISETGIPVMVIRLTMDQFKELSINAASSNEQMVNSENLKRFYSTLKNMCSSIHGMLGPV